MTGQKNLMNFGPLVTATSSRGDHCRRALISAVSLLRRQPLMAASLVRCLHSAGSVEHWITCGGATDASGSFTS